MVILEDNSNERHLTWYANQIEMACEYYHESNDIYTEIKIARKKFLEKLKDEIDFNNLSKQEAIELSFIKWSEEGAKEKDVHISMDPV